MEIALINGITYELSCAERVAQERATTSWYSARDMENDLVSAQNYEFRKAWKEKFPKRHR